MKELTGRRRMIEKEKNVTMAGRAHKSGNREELLNQAMNAGRLR